MSHMCADCFKDRKSWDDCLIKTVWYPPHAIFFCRYQMIWLIIHRGELEEDKWPDEVGYANVHGTSVKSPFETPREYLAELNKRLETTGRWQNVLIEEIDKGSELCGEARNVLAYISRWRRLRITYSQWIENKKRSKK